MLNDITVKASDGTTDIVLDLASTMANRVKYMDQATDLQEPRFLELGHALKPIGSKGSDRHHLLVQHSLLDSEGNPQVVSVKMTITVPRSAAVTSAIVKDSVAIATNTLALSGVLDDFINGRNA